MRKMLNLVLTFVMNFGGQTPVGLAYTSPPLVWLKGRSISWDLRGTGAKLVPDPDARRNPYGQRYMGFDLILTRSSGKSVKYETVLNFCNTSRLLMLSVLSKQGVHKLSKERRMYPQGVKTMVIYDPISERNVYLENWDARPEDFKQLRKVYSRLIITGTLAKD